MYIMVYDLVEPQNHLSSYSHEIGKLANFDVRAHTKAVSRVHKICFLDADSFSSARGSFNSKYSSAQS